MIRSFALLAAVLAVLATTGYSPADEETPETKTLISKLKDDLKSPSAIARTSSYKAMGELGAKKGKSLRRSLCEGMMDKSPAPKVAAADSLKQIDPEMYKLALAIHINRDIDAIHTAAKMKLAAEPLTPLIFNYAGSLSQLASQPILPETSPDLKTKIRNARRHLMACVGAMGVTGQDDVAVNKAVIAMISNSIPELRHCATGVVGGLGHRKLALTPLLVLSAKQNEPSDTRVNAIRLIARCVDENTKGGAKKKIEPLRFDNDPVIRAAVEEAMKQLGD